MSINKDEFKDFLIKAKNETYAFQGDNASVEPILSSSKQLEFSLGDYFYRDSYFGFKYFSGQEIVMYRNKVIWSMVYSGGITSTKVSNKQVENIFKFLRKALRLVNRKNIYRGPDLLQGNGYIIRIKFKVN